MHKQIPPEEGERTKASHLHLNVCWVGVQICCATKFSSLLHLSTWSLSITVVVQAVGPLVCNVCC